jgi:hypothetical protein
VELCPTPDISLLIRCARGLTNITKAVLLKQYDLYNQIIYLRVINDYRGFLNL